MIYLFAFRGVNLKVGKLRYVWPTIKYFLACAAMVIIKHVVILGSLKEVEDYFVSGKVIKSFGNE